MRILITGGAGFIGSALVRMLLRDTEHELLTVDKLTYAGSLQALEGAEAHPRHRFEQLDLCDARRLRDSLADFDPEAIVHLAAESHVDRSIDAPADFIHSNVLGTYALLEAALDHWQRLGAERRRDFRLHHVSTDEVYGALGLDEPAFDETSPYDPSSPYAASKAASDHLVRAWGRTYHLPVLVSNCTNNYGPYQYPEKLVPLCILRACRGQELPVYGTGENVRDWIYVEDHVRALYAVLTRGQPGQSYLISARAERSNLQVVRTVCSLLDSLRPDDPVVPHSRLVTLVEDRPGHDLRYAMKADKIRTNLGWRPSLELEEGLARTVRWYLDHASWCREVTAGRYEGERLGMRGTG